jgi:hypothetical protein
MSLCIGVQSPHRSHAVLQLPTMKEIKAEMKTNQEKIDDSQE